MTLLLSAVVQQYIVFSRSFQVYQTDRNFLHQLILMDQTFHKILSSKGIINRISDQKIEICHQDNSKHQLKLSSNNTPSKLVLSSFQKKKKIQSSILISSLMPYPQSLIKTEPGKLIIQLKNKNNWHIQLVYFTLLPDFRNIHLKRI